MNRDMRRVRLDPFREDDLFLIMRVPHQHLAQIALHFALLLAEEREKRVAMYNASMPCEVQIATKLVREQTQRRWVWRGRGPALEGRFQETHGARCQL